MIDGFGMYTVLIMIVMLLCVAARLAIATIRIRQAHPRSDKSDIPNDIKRKERQLANGLSGMIGGNMRADKESMDLALVATQQAAETACEAIAMGNRFREGSRGFIEHSLSCIYNQYGSLIARYKESETMYDSEPEIEWLEEQRLEDYDRKTEMEDIEKTQEFEEEYQHQPIASTIESIAREKGPPRNIHGSKSRSSALAVLHKELRKEEKKNETAIQCEKERENQQFISIKCTSLALEPVTMTMLGAAYFGLVSLSQLTSALHRARGYEALMIRVADRLRTKAEVDKAKLAQFARRA
jgi:hypothetical protein